MNKKSKLKVDKEILSDPLDDSEIKQILNNDAKIIKYSELKNYDSIDDLLPNNKSMIILLYQWGPSIGHWCCCCKHDDKILYFDSYGGKVDEPLSWNDMIKNNQLGQYNKFLSNLFNKSNYKIMYNPIQYQKLKGDLATCGRHCCVFLLLMKEFNMGLHQYYKFMEFMKSSLNMDYDHIVSYLIDNQN